PLTWFCFLAVIGVALIRIAGDIALLPWSLRAGLLVTAAVAWLAVLIPWALRYAPIYLRPRADGKPG
ncbi:MAG TPA: NnrS family protein, partial [Burkholderiales bacterium]|nr:NnrS family protein [Burkholderiales bacterium]